MAAADPSKSGTGGTSPEDGRADSDPFGTAEFRDKLERARQRRARALGQPSPDPAEPADPPEADPEPKSTPATPLLVLGEDARRSARTPAPLTAPRRPPAGRARAPRRLRRISAIWLVALTAAAALASLAVALLSESPEPASEPRPAREFAVDATAPEAPAAPSPEQEAPAPPRPAARPSGLGPEPEAPAPPALASPPAPPAPALAEWAGTPVRVLGADDGAEILADLRDAGLEDVTARPVDLAPPVSVVRFFDAADRPLAAALAERVGADLQDLTSYSPGPEAPGVEVWLAQP